MHTHHSYGTLLPGPVYHLQLLWIVERYLAWERKMTS